VLANLLGQLPGVLNVGEAARYLSDSRMIAGKVPCGCGQDLESCSFWSTIDRRLARELQTFGTRYLHMRYLPMLLFPGLFRRFDRRARGYRRALTALYRHLVQKTGCTTIVDSSKSPTHAIMISQSADVDLHVIHLVRDPRGVVVSWIRPKQYLQRVSPWTVLARWLVFNLATERLRSRATRYTLVRYEEFAHNPKAVLERLARSCCDRSDPVSFVQRDGRARMLRQHDLAGNPDKFKSGEILIRERAWKLPSRLRVPLSLITGPMRWRYGRHSVLPAEERA
jgi:hypothetical protein